MDNTADQKSESEQAISDRQRLIKLGRQDGMSDVAIARALRAGSLYHLNGHTNRSGRKKKRQPPSPSRFDQVAAATLEALEANGWTVTMEDIRSESKLRAITWPRMILCRLLRDAGGSYPQVAAYVGRTDHTTAMYAVKEALKIAKREGTLRAVLVAVSDRFK